MRIALGVSYSGDGYEGWQSQLSGNTVQDKLEAALGSLAASPTRVMCAGRTDAGVHALMQVVHFDTLAKRELSSWVRGTNALLPANIAVQWAREVPDTFHSRASATSRRYSYVLLASPVRPSVESMRVGWVYRPLDIQAMQMGAEHLLGEHDFTSFRAAQCQAKSPIKHITQVTILRKGSYVRLDFEANAFLHHMIRNILGCLVVIGQGQQPPQWMRDVILARNRSAAAPTFSPNGLYFLGPTYSADFGLPHRTAAYDWLP